MSTTVTIAGNSYSVPSETEENWADNVSNLLIALATSSKVLQNSGGTFSLTNELNLGSSYGLKSVYYKSGSPNPASTGALRLANTDSIGFRNSANDNDLNLEINASDQLVFNGTILQSALTVADTSTIDLTLTGSEVSAQIVNDSITNLMIAAGASIAYSKLNLASSITNTDISPSAGIDLSKLATVAINSVMVSDSSGELSASIVSNTELEALSGISSNIQDQIDTNISNHLLHLGDSDNPHSVTKTQVGLGNVDNTSDATKNVATAILSNKTLDAAIVDNGLLLNEESVEPSVPASGRKVVFAKDDGKVYTKDSSGLVREIGSGGTGGGFNLETQPYAQSGVNDWATYNDSAASPVDLEGGTASALTFTAEPNETQILSGSYKGAYKIAKSAANAQGQGWSKAYLIDPAIRASGLVWVTFRYSSSVALALGDLEFYAYDETNTEFVSITDSLADNQLPAIDANGVGRVSVLVRVKSNTGSLRLGVHVATTDTTAANYFMSDIRVTDSQNISVPTIGKWEDITLTTTWTSNTTVEAKKKVIGDVAQYYVVLTLTGAPTATTLDITLDETIKTSNLHTTPESQQTLIPRSQTTVLDNGTKKYTNSQVEYINSTTVRPTYDTGSGDRGFLSNTSPFTFTSGDKIWVSFEVPIEPKQNQLMNEFELAQQAEAVFVQSPSSIAIGTSETDIIFANSTGDDFGSYDTSTGVFTARKAGKLFVAANTGDTNISSSSVNRGVWLKVNVSNASGRNESIFLDYFNYSTSSTNPRLGLSGSTLIKVAKGDEVKIVMYRSTEVSSFNLNGASNTASFFFIPDFTVLGAVRNYEYKEVEPTTTATSAADTYTDVTDSELTLSAGTWEIGYDASLIVYHNGTGTNTVQGSISIHKSDNTLVDKTTALFGGPLGTNAGWYSSVSRRTEITITEETTYKLRIRCSDPSSSGFTRFAQDNQTGGLTDPDNSSTFWARRVK